MIRYPYVAAFHRYGRLQTKPRAFLVHFAEGGGTVGYLSRANPNGVSVHYVIERSGRIVRMLPESAASGSVNPRDLRTTDDASYTSPDGDVVQYGASAARAALGEWARNPNAAVISCEIEGFAAHGPNADQARALAALADDLRTRYPGLALLGHRDFTIRKACPGRRIPWARLGGHYPSVPVRWAATLPRYPFFVYEVENGVVTGRSVAFRGAGSSVPVSAPQWFDWNGRRELVRVSKGIYEGKYLPRAYAARTS